MNLVKAEKELIKKQRIRDAVTPKQKEILRICAKAIRDIHTGNIKEARRKKKAVEKRIKALEKQIKQYPVLRDRLLGICYQEYVELAVMLSVLKDSRLPELNVPADAYVLGTLDAIGEMKREVMTKLLNNDIDGALMLYNKMEEIYYAMEGFSFPSSIVPGLKAKQDVMKRVLEGLYIILVEAQTKNR
ncbi:MAG: hypothetical protein J7K68_05040, partial [Candidatus Diapherotrites archaeon]|nr:hypothetical protein [Candidatus Diapherotrites archaeon]